MDRIDAMQAFVAVADLQGFAPAARKLGLSPSGVTRLIAALEDRPGARLLQRTTRQVTLTDVGARYLERVRRILTDVEEAESSAEGERTRPSGRLVVSAPIGFGRLHVSPVMSAYLMRYPEVSGELRLSDRMINLVEDGVDLAIRIGHLADSSRVAGAARFTTNGAAAAIQYAEGGGGRARVLAYQAAEAIKAGGLKIVLQKFEQPPLPIHIVYPTSRLLSAKVRTFVDLVIETSDWHFGGKLSSFRGDA